MEIKPLDTSTPRHCGAARAFTESRLAVGVVAFPLTQIVEETGLSPVAAKNQLLRLDKNIVRVTPRQQFFLIVRPDHRAMGAPPVEWWLNDYFRWLGRPYYLALQTAAAAYGSSPQAVQVTQVMTDVPRRDIRIGRIRIRFFVKGRVGKTLTTQPSGAYAPIYVSTPEATAFDLVRYAHNIGGIERSAETISPMLPLMRPLELKRVLQAEDEPATAQRLGFVVEALGADKLADIVRDWLPGKLARVLLATHSPETAGAGLLSDRWQVVDNSRSFS